MESRSSSYVGYPLLRLKKGVKEASASGPPQWIVFHHGAIQAELTPWFCTFHLPGMATPISGAIAHWVEFGAESYFNDLKVTPEWSYTVKKRHTRVRHWT